jgi:probable rRNA maturation factor
MEILIKNQQERIEIDIDLIEKKTKKVLEDLGCNESELSILLVDDKEIQKLNKQYRGIDSSTDVLSFSMGEGEGAEVNRWLLGDIIISLETASNQANERGHDIMDEVLILIVHGILHLLGYHHEDSDEYAKKMKDQEQKILRNIL